MLTYQEPAIHSVESLHDVYLTLCQSNANVSRFDAYRFVQNAIRNAIKTNHKQNAVQCWLNNEPNTLIFNSEQYNLRCHQHIAWSLTLILTHLNHIDEESLPIRPSSLGLSLLSIRRIKACSFVEYSKVLNHDYSILISPYILAVTLIEAFDQLPNNTIQTHWYKF